MAEEHPPVKAIRFGDIGGFFEEAFVAQEVYRTITAGISPYLSKKRGISLEQAREEFTAVQETPRAGLPPEKTKVFDKTGIIDYLRLTPPKNFLQLFFSSMNY